MRAVVQRVSRATVTSRVGQPDQVHATIGTGLAVLLAFETGDPDDIQRWTADRIAHLRVFSDSTGRMNRALSHLAHENPPAGSVAAVPNFTLAADGAKGRRPSLAGALPPQAAAERFRDFLLALRDHLPNNPPATGHDTVTLGPVASGVFGSHMHLDITNDGPVTIVIEHR